MVLYNLLETDLSIHNISLFLEYDECIKFFTSNRTYKKKFEQWITLFSKKKLEFKESLIIKPNIKTVYPAGFPIFDLIERKKYDMKLDNIPKRDKYLTRHNFQLIYLGQNNYHVTYHESTLPNNNQQLLHLLLFTDIIVSDDTILDNTFIKANIEIGGAEMYNSNEIKKINKTTYRIIWNNIKQLWIFPCYLKYHVLRINLLFSTQHKDISLNLVGFNNDKILEHLDDHIYTDINKEQYTVMNYLCGMANKLYIM